MLENKLIMENWQQEALAHFKLYAVTDLKSGDQEEIDQIEQALEAGVDVVQLRSKFLSDAALLTCGQQIRLLTRRLKKLFIVNDRVDLMLSLEADGVHLGQDDLPTSVARRLMGSRQGIIGRSTHNVRQALEAQEEGVDYVGFGPLFQTPTKPTYQPVGLLDIAQLNQVLKIPFVCIGGIDEQNMEQVIQAKATRIAVVRAIFSSASIPEAVRAMKEKIK